MSGVDFSFGFNADAGTETKTQPDLLAGLTPEQREAASHIEGPLLVVAGPGSGKTRVLAHRVAYMVQQGIAPWHLLAITFTNKAAQEMGERIAHLLGGSLDGMTVCTFHSLCARLLRRYAPPGRNTDFSILDADDQKACVKRALKALELDAASWKPQTVLSRISKAKNALVGCEAFAEQATGFADRTLAQIYSRYEALLAEYNALDFDDLLVSFVKLLQNDDVVTELRERYRYISVDEYQDTNTPQCTIANRLAGPDGNLFVVGDPDQSIYKWRGAEIRNILEFERHHPSARELKLEQNFRSTARILEVAQGLIEHNSERREKVLRTTNPRGDAVQWWRYSHDGQEARAVAEAITARLAAGVAAKNIAVFYRANYMSRRFELELKRLQIPYVVIGSVPFFQRAEIKDVLAFVKLLANPADLHALSRTIRQLDGLGAGSFERLRAFAEEQGLNALETLLDERAHKVLRGRQRKAVAAVAAWLRELVHNPSAPVEEVLTQVVERCGIIKRLEAVDDPSSWARIDNVKALIDAGRDFDTGVVLVNAPGGGEKPAPIRAFLDQASLLASDDKVDRDAAVRLMTLHAAKGLEFDDVFIVGVDERMLPLEREGEVADVEEERRLLYVGITRGRFRVTLTSAATRTTFGYERMCAPSTFKDEVPEDAVQFCGALWFEGGAASRLQTADVEPDERVWDQRPAYRAAPAKVAKAPPRLAMPMPKRHAEGDLRQGMRVSHKVFGGGRIESVTGSGPGQRVCVNFDRVGPKTLVRQYANLSPVEG